MKNIWKSLFVAALFVSCSESMIEETVAPEASQDNAIRFEVATAGGRAAFFQGAGHGAAFEAGDELGIRSWTGSETYDVNTRGRGNYEVKADGTLTLKPNTWGQPVIWGEGVDTYITACYPATPNANANNISAVTLPSAQTQAAAKDHSHIGDYMIMSTSKPYVFAADNHPASVALSLQNVLSIVEVTLTGSEAVEVASLTMRTASSAPLAFSAGKLDTTLNLAETDTAITVTTGVSAVTLNLTTPATVDAKGAEFYFVVLPGTHAKKDIVLSAYTTDGKEYRVEMGKIEFKMNNVYRPKLDLAQFEKVEVAEIEIVGEGAMKYFGSTNFENGSYQLYDRTTYGGYGSSYFTYGIPEQFQYTPENTWQTMVSNVSAGAWPVTKTIRVATSGYVYLLVRKNLITGMKAAGWEVVSASEIFYGKNADTRTGEFYLCRKSFEAGTLIDWAEDCGMTDTDDFAGVRPVAKKITWPLAKVAIAETETLKTGGGKLAEFAEGAQIASSYGQTVSTTWVKGTETKTKSIPAGYVGMKMYTVKRASGQHIYQVTGTTSSAGWVYQICPEQAWEDLKADGWKRMDHFILTGGNDIDFFIVGKWFESGATVATLDYTEKVAAGNSSLQHFNTGILLGDLSIAQ